MARRLFHAGVLLAAAGCTAGTTDSDERFARLSSEEIVLERVHAAYVPTLSDTVALGRPIALAVSGDTIVVVDRDALIAVFDRQFQLLARWGQRGEGPGELSNPTDVVKTTDGWAVADIGNGRLERFDGAGTPAGSVRLSGYPTTIAVIPDGVLMPSSDSTYLQLVTSEGQRPWGPAVRALDDRRLEERRSQFEVHKFAQFDEGLVILNGATGDLIMVDNDETVLGTWSLPDSMWQEVFAAAGITSGPGFIAHTPAFHSIAAERTGRWLALMTTPATPYETPVFVDLTTGVWYPSRIDFSRDEWPDLDWARGIYLEESWVHVSNPRGGTIRSIPLDLSNRE